MYFEDKETQWKEDGSGQHKDWGYRVIPGELYLSSFMLDIEIWPFIYFFKKTRLLTSLYTGKYIRQLDKELNKI